MKCPHCKNIVSLTGSDIIHAATHIQRIYKKDYQNAIYAARISIGRCPNNECGGIIVWWKLTNGTQAISISDQNVTLIGEKSLASGMIFPEVDRELPEIPSYVPDGIRSDIIEACKIRILSPKASATLIRRALQGMIRDYWKIVDKTLNKEIEGIKDKIDPMTWDAIDSVRKLGNIGAHMEKDVDVIIDIEPDEAEILIQLSLDLIHDWYVIRYNRELRKSAIIKMATDKKGQKEKI